MTCVHHWMLDPPNGPFSRGVCQKCGEERTFANSEARKVNPWRIDGHKQRSRRVRPQRKDEGNAA